MNERLVALAWAGGVLAMVLVLGLTQPLSIRRNPTVVVSHRPLADVLGPTRDGAWRFVLLVLCAFAAFAFAVWLARLVAGLRAFWLVLAGTVLLSATLIPINPLGTQDIYKNIADARTLWIHGENPSRVAPDAYPDDAFLPNVPVWRDYPSVYGPLWYVIAGAPLPFAGDALWPNVIGQKILTAAFLLGCTALVMRIAARVRPGTAAMAGVLVGWNPLLQWETAGNAHNDVVMLFFALTAIYAIARGWWAAVFPLLALSVATKYVLVLLGPLLLVWLLRRRDVPRRQIMLSLVLGAAVTFAIYAPAFAGGTMIEGMKRQSSYITASTGAALEGYLFTRRGMPIDEAIGTMKLLLGSLFLAGYAITLWSIPRDPRLADLARAGFWAMFLLLVTATWWFWPWYLLWLVPLAALTPGSRRTLVAVVFSASAMLMYVAYFWLLYTDWVRVQTTTFKTIFIAPVAVALALALVTVTPWLARQLRRRQDSAAKSGALEQAQSGSSGD